MEQPKASVIVGRTVSVLLYGFSVQSDESCGIHRKAPPAGSAHRALQRLCSRGLIHGGVALYIISR